MGNREINLEAKERNMIAQKIVPKRKGKDIKNKDDQKNSLKI